MEWGHCSTSDRRTNKFIWRILSIDTWYERPRRMGHYMPLERSSGGRAMAVKSLTRWMVCAVLKRPKAATVIATSSLALVRHVESLWSEHAMVDTLLLKTRGSPRIWLLCTTMYNSGATKRSQAWRGQRLLGKWAASWLVFESLNSLHLHVPSSAARI